MSEMSQAEKVVKHIQQDVRRRQMNIYTWNYALSVLRRYGFEVWDAKDEGALLEHLTLLDDNWPP